MKVQLKKVQDDFKIRMDKMLKAGNNFQGAAARLYPLYQKYQVERFQTEGASEGYKWDPPQEPYRTYKKSRYGGGPKRGGQWKTYPGSGTKTLIATSTLAGAVIGPGSPFVSSGLDKHRAIFTSTSMTISLEQSGTNEDGKPFNYAGYVNAKRPIMKFSSDHIQAMKGELRKYILS